MLPAPLHRLATQLFDNGVLRLIFENTRNMAVSSLITISHCAVGLSSFRRPRPFISTSGAAPLPAQGCLTRPSASSTTW